MQTALRLYKELREKLSPTAPGVPAVVWQPKLVFQPGFFSYNSETFDIRSPGLYVFTNYWTASNPWNNTTHMIVSDGDPVTLLSAAAWLSTFGDTDNGLTQSQLSVKARTSTLQLLCGILHPWVRDEILTPQGVVSRRAHFLTMNTPNNVVDGHEAVEVMIGGQWVLSDLSNNCIVTDAGGTRLSARDAVIAIAANSFEHETLAEDIPYAVDVNGGFNAQQYALTFLSSPEDRKQWHRDIFQAVGLWKGGELWWKLPPNAPADRAAWVEGLQSNYRVKPPEIWDAAFY